MKSIRSTIAAALAAPVFLIAGSSLALTYPFTENFASGAADWRNNVNAALTPASPGGIYDSGYVTTDFAFTSADQPQEAIFRGQDGFNSSGDAFVGNWLATEVSQLVAFVRHDAPIDLDFFLRVATSGNSPAVSFTQPSAISPGSNWTKLVFDISFANPLRVNEGPPSLLFYNGVMSSVGNVQIGVLTPPSLIADATRYAFDLDRVSIVPEPASLMLALCGAALVLTRRRRG